jgi:hypothetical protein
MVSTSAVAMTPDARYWRALATIHTDHMGISQDDDTLCNASHILPVQLHILGPSQLISSYRLHRIDSHPKVGKGKEHIDPPHQHRELYPDHADCHLCHGPYPFLRHCRMGS